MHLVERLDTIENRLEWLTNRHVNMIYWSCQMDARVAAIQADIVTLQQNVTGAIGQMANGMDAADGAALTQAHQTLSNINAQLASALAPPAAVPGATGTAGQGTGATGSAGATGSGS